MKTTIKIIFACLLVYLVTENLQLRNENEQINQELENIFNSEMQEKLK